MAIHALALAKPTPWKDVAEKGRNWLWSQQETDGSWKGSDPVYLTVLVLGNAINLADERRPLTFTRQGERGNDTVPSAAKFRHVPKKKARRSIGSPEAVKACQTYIDRKGRH